MLLRGEAELPRNGIVPVYRSSLRFAAASNPSVEVNVVGVTWSRPPQVRVRAEQHTSIETYFDNVAVSLVKTSGLAAEADRAAAG